MAESLIIDPTSEDAANVELDLMPADGSIAVVEHSYPAPPMEYIWAGGVDTEGDRLGGRRYQNRQISLTLSVSGNGVAADLHSTLRLLEQKVAKLGREGGTLKRTFVGGEVIVFDILAAESYEPTFDITYYLGHVAEVRIGLIAKPFGRGPEESLTAHSETTAPAVVFTETDIKGDVPALGRLVVTNDDTDALAVVIWGLRSRNYSSDASAALTLQAEDGTLGSGSAIVADATAMGGNTVREATTTTGAYETVVTWAGTHVGTYRVIGRFKAAAANTGDIRVRLSWRPDRAGPVISNAAWDIDDTGAWYAVDLGMVTIPETTVGTQGWEARIDAMAVSASGDDIDVDAIWLIPIDEGSGQASSAGSSVVYAGRSMAFQHNGVFTERETGTYWGRAAKYEGDLLLVPPAGAEDRTLEVIVRSVFDEGDLSAPMADDPQDVTAQLHYTPRYLSVPEA